MNAQAQKAEVAAHPAHKPMDLLIRKMESDQREQLLRLVNTAYHVAKLELPFASFPSLLSLQTKNGLEIGSSYKSDKACSRYDFSVENCFNKIQKKQKLFLVIFMHVAFVLLLAFHKSVDMNTEVCGSV